MAEAMLANAPAVVTDLGGICDIVQPEFSEIVSPRQFVAIIDAVLGVAAPPLAERKRRVGSAREYVEQSFVVGSFA